MQELEPGKLTQAGDYDLFTCQIVSYRIHKENQKPVTIDIKPIVGSIEISESIFQKTIQGKIQVLDGNDIKTILPITGLEKVHLKFNTPGAPGINFTEETGKEFHIYKIDRVNQLADARALQAYDIYFTSKEQYYNRMSKVSKAYAGPLEDAVEDILRSKKYLNSTKPFYFEPTKTNAKYVIPSLRPFNAIQFLCKQSVSQKYKNAGYFFYETNQGFHFRRIESMLAMDGSTPRPIKYYYNFGIRNRRDKDGNREVMQDMRIAYNYDLIKNVDVLKKMENGMFANKLTVHDAFNKTITTHEFDYMKTFDDYFHTESGSGKQLIPFQKFDNTGKDLSQFAEAKSNVVTETSKVHNDFEFTPTKDTLPIITSQRQQFQNLSLGLEVPGNSLLNAGDIIHFNVPLMQPPEEDGKEKPNPYISGRYLVWGVRHVIAPTANRYSTVLQCTKDAVNTQFPVEQGEFTITAQKPKVSSIYEEDRKIMGNIVGAT